MYPIPAALTSFAMAAYTVREECDELTGEYRESEAGKDRDPLHPVTLSPFVQSPVPGFTISGRLTKHHLRNEAELDSLALRLAGSLLEASPHGLLRTALDSYMSNG